MMKKEDLLKQAERLGIDLTGLDWNQSVSIVSKALRDEEANEISNKDREIAELKRKLQEREQRIQTLEVDHEGRAPGRAPTHEESKLPIMVAPEIPKTDKNYPAYSYKEELGYDLDYEEADITLDQFARNMNDNAIGINYKVRGKKSNRVVADTAGPRWNPGIRFDPKRHCCCVAVEQGKERGYIYSSPVYFDFLDLMNSIDYGIYLDEYKQQILREQFMVGGHICLPIHFVDNLFRKITAKEKRKKREEDAEL